jgi:superfamily II DNA or RNA helicase
MRVVAYRSNKVLVLKKINSAIDDLLTPHMSYQEKRFAQGYERKLRRRNHEKIFDIIEWECFVRDHKGRLAFPIGFRAKVTELLRKAGHELVVKWVSKKEHAAHQQRLKHNYKPYWERIEALENDTDTANPFEFRFGQREVLEVMTRFDCGRINCPTGWGKGTIIMLLCLLYPHAKIDIVTKNIAVIKQRLFPELALNLPSVGMIGGGVRITGKRVMCISAGSLQHGREDADFVLVDEGHQACSDVYAAKLARYEHARIWMFSASWDMRLDNKDMRAEALAGPVRYNVTYDEAVDHGMVVPIKVYWSDVRGENPAEDLDGVSKKRAGIWRNETRNQIIANDARKYSEDTQVLITVETLEHALYLKRELPEYKLVYSGQGLSPEDVLWYEEHFPDEFSVMTEERKKKLTRRFERGKLKKAIATTVWNVGVNFKHLEVLIRADAGGSPINDTQIPGRAARINDKLIKDGEVTVKEAAIVHDYLDQFDAGLARKAKGRETSYISNGWEQFYPRRKKK